MSSHLKDHDDQIYGDAKHYIEDHTIDKFEDKSEEEKNKFLERLWEIFKRKKGGKSKRKRSSRRKRKTKRSRKHLKK